MEVSNMASHICLWSLYFDASTCVKSDAPVKQVLLFSFVF